MYALRLLYLGKKRGRGAPIREMEHIRIRSLNPNDSFPVVAELSSPEPEGSHTYANVRLRHGKLNSFFAKGCHNQLRLFNQMEKSMKSAHMFEELEFLH